MPSTAQSFRVHIASPRHSRSYPVPFIVRLPSGGYGPLLVCPSAKEVEINVCLGVDIVLPGTILSRPQRQPGRSTSKLHSYEPCLNGHSRDHGVPTDQKGPGTWKSRMPVLCLSLALTNKTGNPHTASKQNYQTQLSQRSSQTRWTSHCCVCSTFSSSSCHP